MRKSLCRLVLAILAAATCLVSVEESTAATYTVLPTHALLTYHGSLTFPEEVYFEPVYSLGSVDWEDILAFQVAIGALNGPSFLYNISAQLPVPASYGSGYAPAPNSVVPGFVSTGGPNAAWSWSGYDNAPIQTAILTGLYKPGALGSVPIASRQAQIDIYMSAFGPETFSVTFVPVPEPSTAACVSLVVAGVFGASRRGRPLAP